MHIIHETSLPKGNNMKILLLKKKIIYGGFTISSLLLNPVITLAFPDLSEPNDTREQATLVQIDDQTRVQYTLHSLTDEDWFKFYAWQGQQVGVKVDPVGNDIDVAFELYDAEGKALLPKPQDTGLSGEKEILSRQSISTEGFFYIKITDVAKSVNTCRVNMQYELHVSSGQAGVPSGSISGTVKDAVSGTPITEALMYLSYQPTKENTIHCHPPKFTDTTGEVVIGLDTTTCPVPGLYTLTVEKTPAYQSSVCQIPLAPLLPTKQQITLWPEGQSIPPLSPAQLNFHNGDTLKPSQSVYHEGDRIQVDFDLHELVPEICAYYYLAILYPTAEFFLITERIDTLEKLVKFDLINLLPWQGQGNRVIDLPVDSLLPRGKYLLYLLRMPTAVTDPLAHLGEIGELTLPPVEFLVE